MNKGDIFGLGVAVGSILTAFMITHLAPVPSPFSHQDTLKDMCIRDRADCLAAQSDTMNVDHLNADGREIIYFNNPGGYLELPNPKFTITVDGDFSCVWPPVGSEQTGAYCKQMIPNRSSYHDGNGIILNAPGIPAEHTNTK